MLRISLERFAQHDSAIEGFTCAALLCPELFPYAFFANSAQPKLIMMKSAMLV